MGPPMGPPPGRLGPREFLTDEEKKGKIKPDKAFIRRILSYLKPYKKQIAIIFILNILYACIGLLPSILTGKIVDDALYKRDLAKLLVLISLDAASLVAGGLLLLLQRYRNSWLSQQVIYDMKNQMYDHLLSMPYAFFTGERQGDVITRMTSDIEGVQSVISDTLTVLVRNVFVVITTMAALFTMNWQLALIGIAIVPLLQIPARKTAKKRWLLLSKAQGCNDELNQHISETLSVSGALLVKIYNKEQTESARFRKMNRSMTDVTLEEQKAGQRFMAFMEIFTQIGPVLIYLFGGLILICGRGILAPGLTVGTIVAIVSLIGRLYQPVSSLMNIQVSFTRSFALFGRIFAYYDRESDIQDCPDPIRTSHLTGDIRFSHVSFSYRENQPILKDISFVLPEGCTYALVGPSGAGKTTLTNLIPRLYDTGDGEVLIGGINVKKYDLRDLRSCIGIVTQDTYLFNGTIRENLLYAKEDATQKELEDACRMANIHDYIIHLPEQYDSLVGNRGLKLSGGEKQRISIARVILKNPDILILDEATSSLDSIAENNIQDAIEPLLKGRTSLVIAHRLSTILSADKILVLENGVLVETGTHEELIRDSRVYRELYETQFRRAIEQEKHLTEKTTSVFL